MLLVVSPHLDDAVFGCGALLAMHPGSTVLTVFAGLPDDAGARRTEWDARCGFEHAAAAMSERRREDAAALARLGAGPRWLDFCDSQYGATPGLAILAGALSAHLRAEPAEAVLFPLGLFHSDHRLVHDAVRAALPASAPCRVYEDALYRALPGLLQERLGELAAEGLRATPARDVLASPEALRAKAEAVAAYASQLRAFGAGGWDDVFRPERCWRLERRDG